ncbi:cytochrome P450 4V2-like isoform X2 [Diorhabda carinulata]|nr:cytochrome P450 4V2-like isoform X2 [Diorhabda carinulata]
MLILFCDIIILVLVFFIYLLIKKYENSRYLKNLQGPKPNFFLGNGDQFLFKTKEQLLELMMDNFKIHGRLIKIYIGPVKLGIVTADATFNELLLSSTKIIDKSQYYGFLHAWLGTGLLTSTGKKWKKHRRIITPTFHFSILHNYVEVFESVGDVFIEKLGKHVGSSGFDIFPLVTLCTLDVICETAMGTKLDALNNGSSEYVKSVRTMCSIFIDRISSVLHPSLYCLTPNYYREQKALKVLHHHTESIIEKRIEEMSRKDESSYVDTKVKKKRLAFLDLLLNSRVDGESLSREEIREEVDTFMFEGHDTTAAAISFALYCLSTNPGVQEKAYQEQRNIFGKNLKNAKPTIPQLQDMKYLDKVLKETLRLYPSVPFLARRTPSEEMKFGEYTLPKNIDILISIFAMHRDPIYFPDPLKMDPDRFDDDSNRSNSFVYTPFSAGPRNCIGQKFAMLEMKSIISKVLRNYKLLPTNPFHEIKLVANIVLGSNNGICLTLEKRIDD